MVRHPTFGGEASCFIELVLHKCRYNSHRKGTCPHLLFPQSAVFLLTMKLRSLRHSSLVVAIALLHLNSALAGVSPLSDRNELSSPVPSFDAQTPQDLWLADSVSSIPPPSIAPDTVIIADAADSKDDSHAFCANTDRGSKDQRKLPIRNDEPCANGGMLNRLSLPAWATPWKKKQSGLRAEQDDYNSCLGVSTPAGMALPFHLCCLGIVHDYVNGLADRVSNCVFDFTRCEMYGAFSIDVCCQTFSVGLGSEFATGINCLPRI